MKAQSEAKWTKGPWKVVGTFECGIEGPQCEVIASVIYNDGNGVRQANANLISQAPSLLEALERIVNTIASHNVPVASYLRRDEAEARAVIARAKGEKP